MQARLPFEIEHPAPADAPPVAFVRHPKARRYLIRVEDDGAVRVTIPRWGSKREATAFVESERRWIETQRIRVEQERLRAEQHRATLPPPPPEVTRELRERAKKELPERLLQLAAQHGLQVTRVSVRNQKWRWGSCSRNRHICLNWRLVQMPDWVRDYVMIHELMHLKRMDHSPKFWALVAHACPEYQAARTWLRAATLS